jgi:hypothetical protein
MVRLVALACGAGADIVLDRALEGGGVEVVVGVDGAEVMQVECRGVR